MEDNELRQTLATMEMYKKKIDALSHHIQILRVSLEEIVTTSRTISAFKDAKEGDDIMVHIGASSFINVKVTSNKNVIVGIGANISVEKDTSNAIAYMDANSAEINEAIKNSISTLNDTQTAVDNLSSIVQKEYSQRQKSQ